jgi:hypothetical protein
LIIRLQRRQSIKPQLRQFRSTPFDNALEQRFLADMVEAYGGDLCTGGAGDIAYRGAIVAALGKQTLGGIEDAQAGGQRPFGGGAAAGLVLRAVVGWLEVHDSSCLKLNDRSILR